MHPNLEVSRVFYAQALEFSGQVEEALAQYQAGRVLSPDGFTLRILEGACLARNGRRKKALLIHEEMQRIRMSAHLDSYYLVLLLDALGKRAEAFQELERTIEENSTSLYKLDVDPNLDSLRQDPRYARFRGLVFGGVSEPVGHALAAPAGAGVRASRFPS